MASVPGAPLPGGAALRRRAGRASCPAFPGRCWGLPAGSGRCSASDLPPGRGRPRRGCKAPVQGILQGVGVLIFIHHHGGVVLPDDPAQRGGGAVRVTEQAEGLMLKVTELQQFPVPLFAENRASKSRTAANSARRRGSAALRSASASSSLQGICSRICANRAAPSSARVRMTFCVRRSAAFSSLSGRAAPPCPAHRGQQIVKRSPLPRHSQLFHPAQQGGSLVQPFLCIGIFFQHGIFAFSRAEGVFFPRHRPAPAPGRPGSQPAQRGTAPLPPGHCGRLRPAADHANRRRQSHFPPATEPEIRPAFCRNRAGRAGNRRHAGSSPRRTVGAALAIEVGKGTEIRITVGIFQRLAQGRSPQKLHTAGVCGEKSGGISSA